MLKGHSVSQISKNRFRSVKKISSQKHQIYKKQGIRSDIAFWLALSLSSCVKVRFTHKNILFKNNSHSVGSHNKISGIKKLLLDREEQILSYHRND
ncbi:TPA: response regulator transcription factor [Escherichia coli]|nr:response regulator transcription factor [Escherichia coli]